MMKIKDGFVIHELGGRVIAMAVGERASEFNGMITLSGSASEIWNLLQNDTTEEAVVADLVSRFEGDEAFIAQDVHRFVEQLRENGLLEE